ncbi:1660_t:CDS:1, partial [Gigaspora rosea]
PREEHRGDPKGPSKGKEPNKLTFNFSGSQSEPAARPRPKPGSSQNAEPRVKRICQGGGSL